MKVIVNGKPLDEMDPVARAAYDDRCAARFAEMIASGRPPRGKTDDTFNTIQDNCNGKQFERQPAIGDLYRRQAEAAGVSTTGKVYLSALAEYPGDPHAWVSGRGDVRRRCLEKGWGCEGAVTLKGREYEHQPVALAEDIVQREVEKRLEADPDQRVEDVREKVFAERAPHWAKKCQPPPTAASSTRARRATGSSGRGTRGTASRAGRKRK